MPMPRKSLVLRDIFVVDTTTLITLGSLAKSLNATQAQLEPLARSGFLHLESRPPITSDSQVGMPPPAAIQWMRHWFQPAQAKPLFSIEDVADLLEVRPKDVMKLAAQHDIPLVHEEGLGGLGWALSMWATRQLVRMGLSHRVGRGGGLQSAPRFDRAAILWALMQGDPAMAATPPPFSEVWEQELARVAALPAEARGMRAAELWKSLQDAQAVKEALDRRGMSR